MAMKQKPEAKIYPYRVLVIGLVLVLSALACQVGAIAPEIVTPLSVPTIVETTVQSTEVSVEQPDVESEIVSRPPSPSQDTPAVVETSSAIVADPFSSQDVMVSLYERVSPGVVAVRQASGGGSGFVIDNEGHIVTNFHVVSGANVLEIDFLNGFKVHGTVIGTDLDSDLAVIKVDAPPKQLHPLPFGNSEEVKIGQTVVAIGNPFGLSGTMTVGIVSAKSRVLASLNDAPNGGFFSAGDIIQTDAAINPGNSGGPLLNLNGEVIGVNRAIHTGNFTSVGSPTNSGIGFAISVGIVKRVTPALIATGFYEYPYLGIASSTELSLFDQEQLGLRQSTGAYVSNVVSGGPSDQAGLRQGDLVIAIDSRDVLVFGDLLAYLITHKGPGDEVLLTVLREGQELNIPIVLGSRPS